MSPCEVLDTFPAFLAMWRDVQDRPLDEQIEAWRDRYLSHWPELLAKQLDDYAALQEDWREAARGRIFPALPQRLPSMRTAHETLLRVCQAVDERARRVTGFDGDLVCVVYVGLGCGAGWATEYDGRPAILFGLENIAEEGWLDSAALSELMAHELGHLVHFRWREQAGLTNEDSPWWQLFTEGFAQRCEGLILGRPSWQLRPQGDPQWAAWCRAHLGWLSAEFLRRVDHGDEMRPFFGSWFDLRGHKQTGYFLGHEVIAALEERMGLRAVALLTDVEAGIRPVLTRLAGQEDL
jgi:hypothetical protein